MNNDLVEQYDRWQEEMERLCHIDGDAIILDAQGSQYDVPLSKCSNYREILGWVSHLSQKSWIRPDVLHRFVNLAREHHGLPL